MKKIYSMVSDKATEIVDRVLIFAQENNPSSKIPGHGLRAHHTATVMKLSRSRSGQFSGEMTA